MVEVEDEASASLRGLFNVPLVLPSTLLFGFIDFHSLILAFTSSTAFCVSTVFAPVTVTFLSSLFSSIDPCKYGVVICTCVSQVYTVA